MLISASVASTAVAVMPVPSSSDTRITPVPVAMPVARPNTPEPTARPVRSRTISLSCRNPAERHGADHHDAEDRAEHAHVEDAVDPGAEHEEGQRHARAPAPASAASRLAR